jgi:hypothetical protein
MVQWLSEGSNTLQYRQAKRPAPAPPLHSELKAAAKKWKSEKKG